MKDPVRPPLPNIILIGLMGCGKTTIGKELHRETNLRFTDTDQLIEQQTGMSIPQIFKIHGNPTSVTWKPASCAKYSPAAGTAASFPQAAASPSARRTGNC